MDGDEAEVELPGWSADERAALGFMLDDDGTPYRWVDTTLVVPRQAAGRVRQLAAYLRSEAWRAGGITELSPSPQLSEAVPPTPADAPPPRIDPAQTAPTPSTRSWIASPWRRFAAAWIDAILLWVVWGIADHPWSSSRYLWLFGRVYELLLIGLTGRTVGARAMRIRVVGIPDLGNPGLWRAFVRCVVPLVTLPLVWLNPWLRVLDFAWLIVVLAGVLRRPLRQGLHDRAAHVVVIDDRVTPTDEWLDLLHEPRRG